MRSNPIACLPEIVKLMRTLSGDSSQVSVSELAEVIQQDPIVLAKVISVANSIGYNPNAVPVTSIHQAIHVIGYERIRSLGMSLMLIEQTSRSQSADEQREMAAVSLTAGCMAQSMAERCLLVDAEQAFVCASLRHFGRLVMTSCMLDEYRSAQELAREVPTDAAYRQIFGLTPLELGHELLKSANLPEDILATLRELPPEAMEVLQQTPDDQVLALTDCASKLAELTLAADVDPQDYVAKANQIVGSYSNVLPHLADQVPELIESAGLQLDQYVRAFKLKSLPTSSLARIRNRRAAFKQVAAGQAAQKSGVTAPPFSAAAPAAQDPAAPAAAPPPEASPENSPASAPASAAAPAAATADAPASVLKPSPVVTAPAHYDWQSQIDRVTDLLRRPGVSPDHVLAAVVEVVANGMGAPECLLFSPRGGRGLYRLSHGLGVQFNALRGAASVDPHGRTVFGVCLSRKENIMIHHASDAKIRPYLPDWLQGCAGLKAFALLPLTDGRDVHGVVLAGWPEARQIVLSPEQVRHIRALLALACRNLGH